MGTEHIHITSQSARPTRTTATVARSLCVALACFACACALVGAPGPVLPDRPGFSDGPAALPAHALELEAGVTDDHVAASGTTPSSDYRSFGESLLRIGVGARTELRLFGNSYATSSIQRSRTISGMEDAAIGAKVNLRSVPDSVHAVLPTSALLVTTTLATGARGLTAGAAQTEAKLAVNWTTPTPLSVSANAGVGAVQTASGRPVHALASFGPAWAVSANLSVFAEGFVLTPVRGNIGATNEADGGVTYLVGDRLQLDVNVGHGVGPATSHERFIGAGVARRW